ncbi:T9SS type A sorting domain-containing protein [Fulvivirga sp. 29W222]|uniref:T9SS type A sorting domain-containing protein n=1 Tax=Fulvivirga marina TaxID=2494733 RepID=A0A937KBB1_9BACT|nr:T9SS type A sorting domain-containing protein [Fulvivirga marina]MBL6445699.1 T9SS type A sorting domain-containing protein [Fulvivirga marina]
MKPLKILIGLFFIFWPLYRSVAQTAGTISTAKIKIIGGDKHPDEHDDTTEGWRLKVEYLGTISNNGVYPCAWVNQVSSGELELYNFVYNPTSPVILKAHGWSEKGGSTCNSSSADDSYQVINNLPVKFEELIPGVNNTVTLYLYRSGQSRYAYYIKLNVYYTVPVPDIVTVPGENFLCLNDNITIYSDIKNISPYSSNTKLKWLYHVDGDKIQAPCHGCNPSQYCTNLCTLSNGEVGCADDGKCTAISLPDCCNNPSYIDAWRSLGTTTYGATGKSYTFAPADYSKIRNGVANGKDITFKVEATAGLTTSISQVSKAYQISKAAPAISSISQTNACLGEPDGVIAFNISGSTGQYYWYLQKKVTSCTQQQILEGNCPTVGLQSEGSSNGGRVYATGAAGSEYYIYVQNSNDEGNPTNGGCYREYGPFSIEEDPELSITQPVITKLTCYGSNDGSVTVQGSGGEPNSIEYGLNVLGEPTQWQESPTFTNLAPGSYVAWIKDRCKSYSYTDIAVEQPADPIAATAEQVLPLCHDQGDGIIIITPTGGYGDYSVTLSKGGDVVKQFNVYSDGEQVVFNELLYGSYSWKVQDVAGKCSLVTGTVDLPEPPRLSLVVQQITPVTCPEASPDDGEATFNVQNAAFPYTITMTNMGTGETFTSNTSTVSALPKGNYSVSITYNNGCPDAYNLSQQVTIEKPEPIVIELVKDDMTCTDSFDAGITAAIGGGNIGDYTYRWQTETGGSWIDFNDAERQDGLTLKNLFDGVYRLYVIDSKGCEKASASVEIVNPDSLIIEEVILSGLECKEEENGHILPGVTGGWGNYIYEYQKLPDTNWQTFDLSDSFDQGTYRIRATDREGCMTEWADELFFAEADEALELISLESKKYNGYDISCYGTYSGEVTLNVKGGLITQTKGYEYAVNDEPFGIDNPITGLPAGEHTFHVRDNNGCVKSQALELIQPENLNIDVTDIKHVKCFGDNTGFIEVEGSGGVGPYIFAIDDQYYRTNPVFNNLTSGTYDLIIRDKNICYDTVTTTINNLFPPITFNWSVDSVTCYNYSDGSASVEVLGGSAPYNIAWAHDKENENTTLSGLTAGDYYLNVRDSEGCIASDTVYIPQPPNINAGPDLNLCYGQNALLDASWRYGSATYQWSNNGTVLNQEPTLYIDKAGKYISTVELDYRECVMHDTVTVDAYDIKFDAKFITATDIVLGDTLQLVETSSPTPDSLNWYFDQRATVLNPSATIPTLLFDEEGTYTIRFAAYYGKCTDSLTKTVTVYLPENVPDSLDHMLFGQTGFKDVRIYPNPSEGVFTLSVELHQKDALGVVIVSSGGMEEFRDSYEASESFEISFDLTSKIAGVYVMKLVTGSDQMSIRMVIE